MQEPNEVHGKKRVEGYGKVLWTRDLEWARLTGFWEEKCETKRQVREIETYAGEKGSTGI